MVNAICQVKDLKPALQVVHMGYPVKNSANKLVGMIPRKMIVTVLEEEAWYEREEYEDNTEKAQQLLLESVIMRQNTLKNKLSESSVMDLFDANQGQTVQLNVEKIDEESESGTSNQQSIGLERNTIHPGKGK